MKLEEYLQKNPKKHIIFDFDETLFYMILPWERYFEKIEEEIVKLEPELYRLCANDQLSLSEFQNMFVERHGNVGLKLIIDNLAYFESTYLQEVRPNHDLIKFIRNNNSYTYHVWTSNTYRSVEKVLKEQNLLDKFDKFASRTTLRYIKPHTEGFSQIYDPKNSKSDYLFLGNSRFDKKAANEVGIDFLFVDYFQKKITDY